MCGLGNYLITYLGYVSMASFCSSRDKILLYLQKYNDQQTKTTVPYGLCQKGIGDNIELSRSRVSRYLNRLIERGYVKEDVKHVVGLKRKRKVYFLTKNGMDEALEKGKT